MAVLERKIVQIDESKCNGCGICVDSCHEGAIQMVNGKAKLISDAYCDGLGDCLKPCPMGAISIVTRSAEAFDAEAVEKRMAAKKARPAPQSGALPCGCPGTMARDLKPAKPVSACDCGSGASESQLRNWPVQLRLISPAAPYLKGADLLLAAECAPAASPDFHSRHLRGQPLAIACPKLDGMDMQVAKLAEIMTVANPKSISVLRMEVPCCGGLAGMVEAARERSGWTGTVSTVVISAEGTVVR